MMRPARVLARMIAAHLAVADMSAGAGSIGSERIGE